MSNFNSYFTPIGSIHLHHLEWAGQDNLPPVIFLPGFIANAYGALKLAQAVSPPLRVLALDLRGRGQSDKPEGTYGIDRHLDDLQQWLSGQGITRFILAGHSFGAAVALFFVHHFPHMVEKLILLDGGTPPSELVWQLFDAYHRNLTYEYESVEAYLAPYRQLPTLQPWTDAAEMLVCANVQETPQGKAVRVVPRYVVESELDALDMEQWRSLHDLYPDIDIPVLLIRAGMGSFSREDRHINDDTAAMMQAGFPDLTIFDMPDSGHTGILTVDSPARDAILRQFLDIA
ncbi:MAG TPA: alpha/beta hydrolase [Aggregatilineales bacterium]|nr:alpha/beta hydrolase [Aggregatilineales bacterium]